MQKNKTPFRKGFLALAIAASLAGCSGGGGGGGSSDSSSSNDVSLSGTAAKGAIAGGIVIAEQLTANGVVELGRATTNATGGYAINLPASYNANNGVVRVRVVPNEDGTTTMTCDAPAGCDGVAFGDPIPLAADSGFEMAAVVTPNTGAGSVSVQVTPFSHMAASAAGALTETPVVSRDDVTTANATMTSLVGFDILNTKTSDLANLDNDSDSGAAKFALLNAAIATNMFDGSGASQVEALNDGLNDLAQSLADGSLDADNTGTDAFNIDALQAAVNTTLTSIQTELSAEDLNIDRDALDAAGDAVSDYQEHVVDVQFAEGLEPVEITEVENQSDVDAAKGLVTDVRTLLQEIEAADFETPLNALGVDAGIAEDIFKDESAQILQLVGDAIESALTTLDADDAVGVDDQNNTVTFQTIVSDEDNNPFGTLTVVTRFTETGLSIAISGVLTDEDKTVTIDDLTLAADGVTDFNFEEDTVTDFITTEGVTVALSGAVSDGSTSITLNDVSFAATLVDETTFTDGQETDIAAVINTMSLNGDIVLQTEGDDLDGVAEFAGAAAIQLVRLDAEAVRSDDIRDLPLSLDLFALEGRFSSDGQSFMAGIELDIEGAASFDSYAFVQYETEQNFTFDEYQVTPNQAEGIFTQVDVLWTQLENQGAVTSFFINGDDNEEGFSVEGYLDFSDGSFGNYQFEADALNAELLAVAAANLAATYDIEVTSSHLDLDRFYLSSYGDLYIQVELNSTAPAFETVDSFLQGQLTIESQLTLQGLPEMRLVSRLDRDSLNGGTVTITPFWGTETYTMTISSENVNAETVSVDVTVENPITGVELSMTIEDIDDTDLEGTVTVNGRSVATIYGGNIPLIRYNDGSFESLY